jgi:hypothetical protein
LSGGQPTSDVVLIAAGAISQRALLASGLGWIVPGQLPLELREERAA